jgi:hypothetical protein
MSRKLYFCAPDDGIHMLQTMKEEKARRLRVIALKGSFVSYFDGRHTPAEGAHESRKGTGAVQR